MENTGKENRERRQKRRGKERQKRRWWVKRGLLENTGKKMGKEDRKGEERRCRKDGG